MRRYIVTGTPGAGKTTIVERLRDLGYPVVAEAATDVIARAQAAGHVEPWRDAGFVDEIVALQRSRQLDEPLPLSGARGAVRFFDRSPICTLALAHYGGGAVSATLAAEVERVTRDRVYERRVFFVRPIGFVVPTAARRITFAQSLAFERIHEDVYRAHGYDLVEIRPGPVAARVAAVIAVAVGAARSG